MDQDKIKVIESHLSVQTNKLVTLFNSEAIDESISWLAFKKGYDENSNNYEFTLDSGEGTQVKFIFDEIQITATDGIAFKIVVDGIIANNAEMNITNLRRHGFDDYKNGPIKKRMIDPYKIYQNFRFHDKVFGGSDNYYTSIMDNMLKAIGNAFKAVMRVGQKRQDKTGVADHEKVAQLDFRRDINDSIAAIQLVDTGMTEINEVIKDVRDWFCKIDSSYNTNSAMLYKNPYTGKSYVSMKVNVKFYTNVEKFKTAKDPKTDTRFTLFELSYTVNFNNETNECEVSENQWNYEKAYYFDSPVMQLPTELSNSVEMKAKIGQSVPYPERKRSYSKTMVLSYLSKVIDDMRKTQKVHDALLASLALQ